MPSLFCFYRVELLSRLCFCLLLVLLAVFSGCGGEGGGRRDAGRLQIRSKFTACIVGSEKAEMGCVLHNTTLLQASLHGEEARGWGGGGLQKPEPCLYDRSDRIGFERFHTHCVFDAILSAGGMFLKVSSRVLVNGGILRVFRFIIDLKHAPSLGDSGSSYIWNMPPSLGDLGSSSI